ncbi:hypothetical protein Tco_0428360 [Tanacetum coccineum]
MSPSPPTTATPIASYPQHHRYPSPHHPHHLCLAIISPSRKPPSSPAVTVVTPGCICFWGENHHEVTPLDIYPLRHIFGGVTLFETTRRRVSTFVPMETEIRRGILELVADSSQAAVIESTQAGGTKRTAEEELGQQSSKKQKPDELSQEELLLT